MKTFFGAAAVAALLATSGLAMAQSSSPGGSTSGTTASPGMSGSSSGAASTAAGATGAATTATGSVSKIDRSGNTVTMQDGTKYKLSSGADLGSVKEGDQVRIQYQMQGSDRMATAVTPATGTSGTSGTTGSSATGSGTTKKQ